MRSGSTRSFFGLGTWEREGVRVGCKEGNPFREFREGLRVGCREGNPFRELREGLSRVKRGKDDERQVKVDGWRNGPEGRLGGASSVSLERTSSKKWPRDTWSLIYVWGIGPVGPRHTRKGRKKRSNWSTETGDNERCDTGVIGRKTDRIYTVRQREWVPKEKYTRQRRRGMVEGGTVHSRGFRHTEQERVGNRIYGRRVL